MSPALFAAELEAVYNLIRSMPTAGEVVYHPSHTLRRLLLSRTRYHLYYILREDESVVEVVALWHTARGIRPPV